MDSHEHLIGQMVISSSFGIGTIIQVDTMDGGDRVFLVVECQKQRVKHFIPVESSDNYRLITSLEAINKVLSSLATAPNMQPFESKKDRINYFRSTSQNQDIKVVAELIKELDALSDRGAVESQILSRLIETLALEYSVITSVELAEAKKIVDQALIKNPS